MSGHCRLCPSDSPNSWIQSGGPGIHPFDQKAHNDKHHPGVKVHGL